MSEPFAVHDFVVAQHQDEMLLEGIHEREGDVAVMKAAEDRIERHVMEEIVHPAHVPFEPEAEAAEIQSAAKRRARRLIPPRSS